MKEMGALLESTCNVPCRFWIVRGTRVGMLGWWAESFCFHRADVSTRRHRLCAASKPLGKWSVKDSIASVISPRSVHTSRNYTQRYYFVIENRISVQIGQLIDLFWLHLDFCWGRGEPVLKWTSLNRTPVIWGRGRPQVWCPKEGGSQVWCGGGGPYHLTYSMIHVMYLNSIPCEQTDACENITFLKLCLRMVITMMKGSCIFYIDMLYFIIIPRHRT